jgi:hypothetical protein
VYRGERNARDAAKIIGESRAHVQELLHPFGAGDANVEYVLRVQMEQLGVSGE